MISLLFKFIPMKFILMNSVWYCLLWMFACRTIDSQSSSCSCQLDGTGMTMICENVQTIAAYQQCVHEQLNAQSDIKLRRGGVITNLTIRHHQLRSVSNGLLQFSYGNYFYQFSDLRYLYVTHGKLEQIDKKALELIEPALEYLDLSNNELQRMPHISNGQKDHNNLVKLILSHNQIRSLTLSDVKAYDRLQQLDLSYNRLQYVDMSIVNHLHNLKKFYLNSNLLRTLTNNVTFPNNFHLKLSSNPLECDCRLRRLRDALNRVEYPIYHDEPRCEMPKALADKAIGSLRDVQFVCGPIISKPDLTVLAAATGEVITLRCDVYSDPAPEVWWTFQNKIIGKMISTVNEPDFHTGSYTIRYSCISSLMDLSATGCLNKTTTLTISNIGTEHNGTYNCVAAIRNQERSDNEYLSYELRVRRTTPLTESSFLLWTIGIFLCIFFVLFICLCLCWFMRCHRSRRQQAQRNKALLFDTIHNPHDSLIDNGNIYQEKTNEHHNGIYDPYDMIDSRSQLGPPMYSEVRIVDSTPLRSIGGGSVSSTLLRRNDPFYDSYRSDKQVYEQVYRPSPLQPAPVDEFEDEMIFPTGYEEDYQYREDIIKPNQAIDPRRQAKVQHTNHDRSDEPMTVLPNGKSSNVHLNYQVGRSDPQYKGLVESQL